MADPTAASATQLRNIQTKTGLSLEAVRALIAASGLSKHGEVRTMLSEKLGLGYGDANALAHAAKAAKSAPAGAEPAGTAVDPLDGIYTGTKAALRPLHEQLVAQIDRFGAYEKAPKKAYVSLRRKKQFAMLGPATKDQLELGLNAKALPANPRLKAMPAGGMCQYTVRLSSAAEIDSLLLGWIRTAFDAAG